MAHYAVLVILGFLFLGFALPVHHTLQEKQLENQALVLQNKERLFSSLNEAEQIHLRTINRVVSVINRFNPSMSHELKYKIATEVTDAALKYENLDVDLICATITHESAFSWDPKVKSKKGALGLMQVMPSTGKFLCRIEGINWTNPKAILFDPVSNIRLGTRYLSNLIELYELDGGLAAYNGGTRRAAMWLAKNRADGILYRETQNYVPAILSLYEEFKDTVDYAD